MEIDLSKIIWHTKDARDVLKAFESSEEGLSSDEALTRLKTIGENKLPESKGESVAAIFLRQFQSPLIYILLIASLIVFFLGEFVDTVIILIVLFVNAIIGAVQEGRAQNTLRALKQFTKTNARVLRGGKELVVEDAHIVPGDIILLGEGDKISADARLLETYNLKLNEAALTGESEPVEKNTLILRNEKLPTADQKNMLFKGTFIASGTAQAIVVGTGLNTVIGSIAKEMSSIDADVPLKEDIKNLSQILSLTILSASVFIFVLGILGGIPLEEMFFTSVAIAVSVIPEGLPIVITLILATGVYRMGKQNALVKKLQAVDALGYATVIAVDKTGTVTKNEMTVERVFVSDKRFDVTGNGYEPEGDILLEKEVIDPLNHQELLLVGKIASLGSMARVYLSEEAKQWKISGDPTEAAIAVFGKKIGFHKNELEKETPLIVDIPMSAETNFHASLHDMRESAILTVIGAPEKIFELCDNVWINGATKKFTQKERETFESAIEKMSSDGLRVIAAAVNERAPKEITIGSISKLTLVCLYGMRDALRQGVRESIEQARAGGVKVVMITGDHRMTAKAIARDAGIWREGDEIVTGKELTEMSEKDLLAKLKKTTVFARVTPQHKLAIIESYRKNKEIVAMTGDGVNDALSLMAADLGVAMGKMGTEVTKEAADIVLLDDNFKSIVLAMEEGRNIYHTIKKVLLYLFSTGVGELFTIVFALFLALPLPLLPTQILWLNLVTDGFLVVAMAMEPKEKLTLERLGKRRRHLVDPLMIQRVILLGLTMTAGSLYLFSRFYEVDIVKGWTIALTTLAVFQWLNVWNCRSEEASIFSLNPFSNLYLVFSTVIVIALQTFVIYNPIAQGILHTTALSLHDWMLIVFVASTVLIVEEIRKFFYRNFGRPVSQKNLHVKPA
ncbi:MAG: HAD-IC family P-type ATPase [Patescibacteria group bacterium]|nr:HAD-IC family P-type ATPase [bacterium]MDZ4240614.1 HAD-IC family P-type ATPase [Patescibacteria group bacterium]